MPRRGQSDARPSQGLKSKAPAECRQHYPSVRCTLRTLLGDRDPATRHSTVTTWAPGLGSVELCLPRLSPFALPRSEQLPAAGKFVLRHAEAAGSVESHIGSPTPSLLVLHPGAPQQHSQIRRSRPSVRTGPAGQSSRPEPQPVLRGRTRSGVGSGSQNGSRFAILSS